MEVEGYEFGGGLVIYVAIDRPTNGRYRENKKELPKIHICQFDIDEEETELYLDIFDTVEEHYQFLTQKMTLYGEGLGAPLDGAHGTVFVRG